MASRNGFRHFDAHTHDASHGNSDGCTDHHEYTHGDGPTVNDAACAQQFHPSKESDTSTSNGGKSTQPTYLGDLIDGNRSHGHCLLPLESEELGHRESHWLRGHSGAELMEQIYGKKSIPRRHRSR